MKPSTRKDDVAGLSVEIDQLVESGILPVGSFVTLETINPIYHGRLLAVTPSYYVMADVSWLGDLGQRASYESGAEPVEANFIGGTDSHPVLIERTCCVTGPCFAPLQRPLSSKTTK